MEAARVRVVPKTYEARFFFADDVRQMFGATILGTAVVTDLSATALQAKAREMIVGDPSGDALELAKTKLVVVVDLCARCQRMEQSYLDHISLSDIFLN